MKMMGSLSGTLKDSYESFLDYLEAYEHVDDRLKIIIKSLKEKVLFEDDDALVIIAGQVSSGKSTLAHHIHTIWSIGAPSVSNVAFDKAQLANVLDETMKRADVNQRICHYDEANVSRREAMTKFNRAVIDLFEAIRSKNGLHLWCNPSVEYLERKFLEERVKAVIYCYREPKGQYLIIPRLRLLSFLDKHKRLTHATIEMYGQKFSVNKRRGSWFCPYPENDFLIQYLEMKDSRENYKLEAFKRAFGVETVRFSASEVCRNLGVTYPTLMKYLGRVVSDGLADFDELRGPTGRWEFSVEVVEVLKKYLKKKGVK